MESHQLLKLCRDCGLLTKFNCRKADVDLVFHRARAETIYAKVRRWIMLCICTLQSQPNRSAGLAKTSIAMDVPPPSCGPIVQMKGAAKLQYQQFLHALMLIAEKRRSGFCEVTDRVRNYGSVRRAASMADFLVMHDPPGLAEDPRDLERPRGLPKLRRNLTARCCQPISSTSKYCPADWDTTVMHLPSAAHGIRAARDEDAQDRPCNISAVEVLEDDEVISQQQKPGGKWQAAAEPGIAAAVHGGTGVLKGTTASQMREDEDVGEAGGGAGQGCVCMCQHKIKQPLRSLNIFAGCAPIRRRRTKN